MPESNERRRGPRHRTYLAAEIRVDSDSPRIAVTKDVSESGLLLLTRADLAPGQAVTLTIHRPGELDRPLQLAGRVVRREPLSRDEIGTWREKVAFSFDALQPELAEEFAELAEVQAQSSTMPPPPDTN